MSNVCLFILLYRDGPVHKMKRVEVHCWLFTTYVTLEEEQVNEPEMVLTSVIRFGYWVWLLGCQSGDGNRAGILVLQTLVPGSLSVLQSTFLQHCCLSLRGLIQNV